MNALVKYHLRKFCDKHGIDYQEIDETLTYGECMDHLRSLVTDWDLMDQAEWMDEQKSREEQYMKEHALSNYIMACISGQTVSEEVGDPRPLQRFPLADYIKSK